MFKRRHSFPKINASSNVNNNLCEILSDEDEGDNNANEENVKPNKWNITEKMKIKASNKHRIVNVSSEDIDEVLKPYCKECQHKNKAFIELINNVTQKINEAKSYNRYYKTLSLLQHQEYRIECEAMLERMNTHRKSQAEEHEKSIKECKIKD